MDWQISDRILRSVLLLAFVGGCTSTPAQVSPRATSLDSPEINTVLNGFQAAQIKQHMTVLADDKLERRGLGTVGYEEALSYVEKAVQY